MDAHILILAAGQGNRMGGVETPKVLTLLRGRPMIDHLLDAVRASNVCPRPTIVVGHRAAEVRQYLGDKYDYVVQEEQRGTGHAVACAQVSLNGLGRHLLILFGDKPCLSPTTIRRIVERHTSSGSVLTMATIEVPDYKEWRSALRENARVIRGEDGQIICTVEARDASPEQLGILELGTGTYCFQTDWLWSNIGKLGNNNSQREYYLTDLLAMALEQGLPIATVVMPPHEGLGINSLDQLELVTGVADWQ